MRVLVCTDHPDLPTGIGTQTRCLLRALDGVEDLAVYVLGRVGRDWRGPHATDCHGATVQAVQADSSHLHTLSKTDFGLVVVFGDGSSWSGVLLRPPPCPLVWWHYHGSKPAPTWLKPVYDACAEVLCVSRITERMVDAVAPGKARYLPHALPPDYGDSAPVLEAFAHADDWPAIVRRIKAASVRFLAVGANMRRKGWLQLLAGWAEYLKIASGDPLLIACTPTRQGAGADLPMVAEAHGIDPASIVFVGSGHAPGSMPALYRAADWLVHVPHLEGFGLPVLEAMVCGTPVVGLATGGIPDMIGGSPYCICVEPDFHAPDATRDSPVFMGAHVSPDTLADELYHAQDMVAGGRYPHVHAGTIRTARERFPWSGLVESWRGVIDRYRSGVCPAERGGTHGG